MIKQLLTALLFFCLSLNAKLPDFEKAMGRNKDNSVYRVEENRGAEYYKSSYIKNNFEAAPYSINPQIPKIIHHIWLGSPLPEIYRENVESWKKMHPDWMHILWTDDDVGSFNMQNIHLFNWVNNFGAKSDIWRYEILYRYGGLYVDTDAYCLKPFDLFHHTSNFYVGVIGRAQAANGLIGSAKGHPIMKKCIDALSRKQPRRVKSVIKFSGPKFFTQIFVEELKNNPEGIVAYPAEFFYPMPHWENLKVWRNGAERKDWEKYVKPNSYAIHLHAESWKSYGGEKKLGKLKNKGK